MWLWTRGALGKVSDHQHLFSAWPCWHTLSRCKHVSCQGPAPTLFCSNSLHRKCMWQGHVSFVPHNVVAASKLPEHKESRVSRGCYNMALLPLRCASSQLLHLLTWNPTPLLIRVFLLPETLPKFLIQHSFPSSRRSGRLLVVAGMNTMPTVTGRKRLC